MLDFRFKLDNNSLAFIHHIINLFIKFNYSS